MGFLRSPASPRPAPCPTRTCCLISGGEVVGCGVAMGAGPHCNPSSPLVHWTGMADRPMGPVRSRLQWAPMWAGQQSCVEDDNICDVACVIYTCTFHGRALYGLQHQHQQQRALSPAPGGPQFSYCSSSSSSSLLSLRSTIGERERDREREKEKENECISLSPAIGPQLALSLKMMTWEKAPLVSALQSGPAGSSRLSRLVCFYIVDSLRAAAYLVDFLGWFDRRR